MHFSFKNVIWDQGIAHGGNNDIFFKRVLEKSKKSAFNFLDLVIIPVGSDIGLHTHAPDNQEVYIIISGEGEMIVNEEKYNVVSGSVIVNPIGGTHSLRNSGKTDIYLVVIETPILT